MGIGFRVDGVKEAREFAVSLPGKVATKAILDMAQIAYDSMLEGAGAHDYDTPEATHRLLQSVVMNDLSSYNLNVPVPRFEVGHNLKVAPYAPFVVFGARPHRIDARDRKALRWTGQLKGGGGEGFIFAKWVDHPGYAGDDYVTTSATKALDKLREIVDNIDIFK